MRAHGRGVAEARCALPWDGGAGGEVERWWRDTERSRAERHDDRCERRSGPRGETSHCTPRPNSPERLASPRAATAGESTETPRHRGVLGRVVGGVVRRVVGRLGAVDVRRLLRAHLDRDAQVERRGQCATRQSVPPPPPPPPSSGDAQRASATPRPCARQECSPGRCRAARRRARRRHGRGASPRGRSMGRSKTPPCHAAQRARLSRAQPYFARATPSAGPPIDASAVSQNRRMTGRGPARASGTREGSGAPPPASQCDAQRASATPCPQAFEESARSPRPERPNTPSPTARSLRAGQPRAERRQVGRPR